MTPARTAPCETLVHVSAPGSARDDAHYLAHAQACLDFQPVSRLSLASDLDDARPFVSSSPGDTTSHDQGQHSLWSDQDTALGYHSADTGYDAEKTSSHRAGHHVGLQLGPTSIIENQRPDEVTSASSIRNRDLSDDSRPHDADNDIDPEQDSSFQTPPSTVPNSQPILTQEYEIERDNSPSGGRVKVLQPSGVQYSSPQNPLLSPRARKKHHVRVPSQVTPSNLFSSLPLEIRPPPPVPSSTADFTTHITPTLRMLSQQMNLARLFRPVHESRPLRTLERGYWFLRLHISSGSHFNGDTVISGDAPQSSLPKPDHPPANAWPIEHFTQFWNYLSIFIGQEGRAGWGVWAVCETSSAREPSRHDFTSAVTTATCDGNSVTIKVFTWGEIAPHIYLLLYLASERRVKYLEDVEWRDGGESTVLRMR